MKKFLQLLLFIISLIIALLFYLNYLKDDKKTVQELPTEQKSISNTKNNLIKNLKYDVRFEDNSQYTINADLSELTYEDEIEIVKMQTVRAKFTNADRVPLIIKSNFATYNNSTYNSSFSNQVTIEYMDNIIKSENLDLNFIENIATIYNNVVYEGLKGELKADNVIINLITKNIEIFMNNSKEKVEITSK